MASEQLCTTGDIEQRNVTEIEVYRMGISTKKIKRNLIVSVTAQVISIFVSLLISLIVPKFISELEYSYWQSYVLYVSYVGILHFGLLDGIVLRYSEYDYDQLDKPRLRSQFQIMLTIISAFALIISITSIGFVGNNRVVCLFVAIGIITKNIYTYSSYTFQITNRISKYAILVISMRVFYGLLIVLFLLLRVQSFFWFCIADLASDLFGSVFASQYSKDLYLGKSISLHDAMEEFWINIHSGVMLMIANWSAGLVIGSAKMIVQWHWDELTFGKFSFSFSLSNLFLTFVSAISVVLFPSLKRMKREELPNVYDSIRNVVSPLLFVAMIFYFPTCVVLEHWLPRYTSSLVYLGGLLPIIIYTSKVSLLTNNYLKAYRKEKTMLLINVLSVASAALLFSIVAYVLNSLSLLITFVVIVIMGRSVASEIVVMKLINRRYFKDFVIEAVMTICFIVAASYFSLLMGFILYFCALAVYCFIYHKTLIKGISRYVKKKT